MIKEISLKTNSLNRSESIPISITPLTIFIGPNHSGKSLTLKEIENTIQHGNTVNNKILSDIQFTERNDEELKEELESVIKPRLPNEYLRNDECVIEVYNATSTQKQRQTFNKIHVIEGGNNPNNKDINFISQRNAYLKFLSFSKLRLNSQGREHILLDRDAGDFSKSEIKSHLDKLFNDDELREEFRTKVYEAFKKYILIDPTRLGKLRFCISETKPPRKVEKSLEKEAVEFLKNTKSINELSDGLKSYVAILCALVAGSPKMFFLDEPEAYLHPVLAEQIGETIASSFVDANKRLFVATHSAHFLIGCLKANKKINIVRLTYDNNQSKVRVLKSNEIIKFMQKPLLRSLGVFNALFWKNVIVTEADSDRVFYQEINFRLLESKDPRGIEDCLFLNVNGKDQIHNIIKALRSIGIPAAAIYDFDVLRDKGQKWKSKIIAVLGENHLNQKISHMQSKRDKICKLLPKTKLSITNNEYEIDWDKIKKKGIHSLTGAYKTEAQNILNEFAAYGLFIVPIGELENWLKYLKIEQTADKNEWLARAFEKLGDDISSSEYEKPKKRDVWNFIGHINDWLTDVNRNGVHN